MRILELSKQYYFEIIDPLLREGYPELYPRLATGLIGNGSECFGFDDQYSMDHDCGIEFYIWVTEQDRINLDSLNDFKEQMFRECPPAERIQLHAYKLPVGALTVGDFYEQLIGITHIPQTIGEWIRVPEENYSLATNGEVFYDGAGEFTKLREDLLRYYPEDIRLKRIAAACMEIAQTGQYNHLRMGKRGDGTTVRLTLARFCEAVMALVFMLNRVYRPYYKWMYRMFCELPILGSELTKPLQNTALWSSFSEDELERQHLEIDSICAQLINELQKQGLASSNDSFMATQGEEIQRSIKTESLRNLPANYKI